ncbi:MAG: HD domain-containing protein [Patescibacteria group bacterium]
MSKDIDFLFEIGRMRFIQRAWQRFFLTKVANDAEHTFRVMWLSLIIAKKEKIKNEEKIIKMALVHDITESRTGDVDYLSRLYSERKENTAISDMLDGVSLEDEFIKLWEELEKKETIEAKIIKDADNLDIDLELMEQKDSNLEIVDWKLKNRQKIIPKKLFTETAKIMFKEIYSSDAHNWHINSRNNRFRTGDWKNNE